MASAAPDAAAPDAAAPCVLVVFGASGDLNRRKIAPALYNLAREGLLPKRTIVLGYSRTEFSDEAFREHLRENVAEFSRERPLDEDVWTDLAARTFYQRGGYDRIEDFRRLKERIDELDARFGTGGSRLFYLAVPPGPALAVLDCLASCGLIERRRPGGDEEAGGYVRVVAEKPFGRDLESARELNRAIDARLDESQVYRIDHYLGKETVQNILVLRFANSIIEPIWNNRHVRHIHVTVAETLGVEGRAGFFERTGALRDVLQSHVLQLLSLVTMEPPYSLSADSIRDEKAKLLRCLRPLGGEELRCSLLRGQYGPGRIDGRQVAGYRREDGVDPNSNTETFVALRTYIDNWRWAGVPIYLATGKRLPERLTEIAVEFEDVPNILFRTVEHVQLEPNVLKIRVQPDEGVSLRIVTKAPGLKLDIRPAEMDFPYASTFKSNSPEAYERLVLDVMAANSTLFARRDEIELAWQFVDPILKYWDGRAPEFPNYPAGTWGPIRGRDFFREDVCYIEAPRR